MMIEKRFALVISFALPFMACNEAPKPQAARATEPQGLKKLALVPPGGTSAIDQEIEKLQALAKKQPDKADNWVLLGRAFVKKARQVADPGFYANADACAHIALDVKPNYTLALSLRGLVLMNDHRFNDARQLAEQTLATDRDDLLALGVLSDALLELGDYDGAADAAQKMLDLKPNLPSYGRASYLKWLNGDFEGAKSTIRLAIDAGLDQRDPEPGAWMICEAAKMFHLAGDYEGAIVGFDRSLVKFPDFAPALLGKARSLLALGKYDEAASLAKKSFEKARLAEAAWVMGDALRLAGRTEEANAAFELVIKVGRQGDKRTLASFFATENRDIEEALKLATNELKTRGDLYTHDAHAWALYRAGRIGEAKTAIDRATRLGTKDPSLLYHAGAIAIAGGDVQGGLAKVREALKLSPKFHPVGSAEGEALLAKHSAQASK